MTAVVNIPHWVHISAQYPQSRLKKNMNECWLIDSVGVRCARVFNCMSCQSCLWFCREAQDTTNPGGGSLKPGCAKRMNSSQGSSALREQHSVPKNSRPNRTRSKWVSVNIYVGVFVQLTVSLYYNKGRCEILVVVSFINQQMLHRLLLLMTLVTLGGSCLLSCVVHWKLTPPKFLHILANLP